MNRIFRRIATRRAAKPRIAAAAAAILALAVAFTVAADAPVSAHANLLEATPRPSAELDAPPDRVIAWFSEPIEPAFSTIAVLAPDGADVTAGDAEFDPTEPAAMWVPLAELENGTYTVVWRNVSAVDGHRVTGSYLFAVGEPLGAAAALTATEQPLLPSPLTPPINWLIYLGIAIFGGGLFFELAITNRLARADGAERVFAFAARVGDRFAPVAIIAIAVVIGAQITQLLVQTTVVYDISIAEIAPSQLIDVVTQSDWGRYWSWRIIAAVIAAAAATVGVYTVRMERRQLEAEASGDTAFDADATIEDTSLLTETPFGIAALASAGVYLLLIALTSHNAATPADLQPIAIATDFVHVVAATVWVGAIAYLAVAARAAFDTDINDAETDSAGSTDDLPKATLARLATAFGTIGIATVAILVASGAVSMLMQVTIPEAMNTPYGRILAVKGLLSIALIALAFKNRRTVNAMTTRLTENVTKGAASLQRFVRIELAVAAAVLLATAFIAAIEPARQYAERHGIGVAQNVHERQTINGADIAVTLDPGSTGVNTLIVGIADLDGDPFDAVDEVRARVKFLDDEFGENFIALDHPVPGDWRLDDVTISIPGAYQLDVTVTRTDAFDSHLSTRFSATSATFASDLIRPSLQAAMAAGGILVAVIAAAYLIATAGGSRQTLRRFSPHHAGALSIAAVGTAIVVNALFVGIGLPDEAGGNPHPLTQASVTIGGDVYAATCATCHGDTGLGDGPAGVLLNPQPADLAIHVPLHTDAELYEFIAYGIEGTPMAPQQDNLTADQIWHLVNYLRTGVNVESESEGN